MLDITAITQSAPGPLPVNASIIIGYRMWRILKASLVAILGTIIPPYDYNFYNIHILY